MRNTFDKYMEYVAPTEPPTIYHKWVFLSVLSAASLKRIWIHLGGLRVWGNMYVGLVGPSGVRKSTAITYGEKFLGPLHVRKVPDAISGWQGFIGLAKSMSNVYHLPGIGKKEVHPIVIFSKELKVFLQNDIQLMASLTDLFDVDETWEYWSNKREIDALTYPSIAFLGATAPDWIQTMLPTQAIGGGFTSRFIWVHALTKAQTAPNAQLDPKLKADIHQDLRKVRAAMGESLLEPPAQQWYDLWYMAEDKRESLLGPRFDGYSSRRAMYLRKVSALRALGRGGSLKVTLGDLEWALALLIEVEEFMPNVFAGMGSSPLADMTYRVAQEITRVGTVTEEDLLARFEYDLDARRLSSVIDTLKRQGVITTSNAGGKPKFTSRITA